MTVVVVLAAPLTVTGLAAAGISVGDAIEVLSGDSPDLGAAGSGAAGDESSAPTIGAPVPGVGVPGSRPGQSADAGSSRAVGSAETVREDARTPAEAPLAPVTEPEAVEPAVPAPEDGTGTEVPEDPAEPAPPTGPLDELDDPVEDPLDGLDLGIDDAIDGLLP